MSALTTLKLVEARNEGGMGAARFTDSTDPLMRGGQVWWLKWDEWVEAGRPVEIQVGWHA